MHHRPARRFVRIAQVALTAVAALVCARVVNQAAAAFIADAATPRSTTTTTATTALTALGGDRDFAVASSANLFEGRRDVLIGVVDDGGDRSADRGACDDETPPTSLRLRLVGVVVADVPEGSAASIAETSAKANAGGAEMYSVGDAIGAQAVLEAIEPERVCLWNNVDARMESLGLDDVVRAAAGATKPIATTAAATGLDMSGVVRTGPTSADIPRELVGKAMADPMMLAKDVRIVPAFEGGKTVGFKVAYVRAGSPLATLGLERGDVVERVNGYEIGNMSAALEVLAKLKDEGRFTIDLKRKGAPMSYDAHVVDR